MIQEVIAYKIKPDRLADFRRIRTELQEKVKGAPGMIGSTAEHSVDDPVLILDVTRWESRDHMEAFNAKFRENDYGAELMECADGGPVFMGCFEVS